MDIQAIIDNLTKSKTISSVAKETGEKKSVVEEVIQNAAPMLAEQLGNADEEAVTKQITAKTGISSDTVMKIVAALAPLVIAYLGQQMTKSKKTSSTKSSKSDNPLVDMATSMLDKDGDGEILDDLAGNLFGKN